MGRLSSIEIYDVSKLDLQRSQNKQADSDSILQGSSFRCNPASRFPLARRIARFIQPRALCFLFPRLRPARVYTYIYSRRVRARACV